MRAGFIGKDPQSNDGQSPALYRTDRTDRVTFLVQGWKVTDVGALADVGDVPSHEGLVEVPIEVLRLAAHDGRAER